MAELITDPALSPTFYRHPNQGHAPLPLLSTLSVSGMENSTQIFQLHQMIPTDTVPIVIEKGGKTTLNKEVRNRHSKIDLETRYSIPRQYSSTVINNY